MNRVLVCSCGEFSACAGDYFLRDEVIECGECGEIMRLEEKTPYFLQLENGDVVTGTRWHTVSDAPTYNDLREEVLA